MKTLKTISISILLLLAGFFADAQVQTITIANGDATYKEVPLNFTSHTSRNRRTQTLYPSTMIGALINSKITKVTFHAGGNSGYPAAYTGPVHVTLGSTTTSSLASAWDPMTGMSRAYSGGIELTSVNSSSSYVAIELTTAFPYTGDNLLIDIQNEGRGGSANGAISYEGTTQTGGSRYDGNGTTYPITGAGTAYNFLPKVTFEFEPVGTAYSITANITGNGTVNPTGTYRYGSGAKPVYTITPAANHYIQSVKLDNIDITSQVSNNRYTFAALDANHTLDVTFAAFPQYTITSTSDENGTISPSGENLYYQGTNQTFTITPNSGYLINQVLVDNSPVTVTDNTYTFTNIQAGHTIHVTFKVDLTLRLTVADGTAANNQIPFNLQDFTGTFFYTQVIYPASAFTQIKNCKIKKLTFYRNGSGGICNTANVVVGTTSTTDLSSGFVPTTGMKTYSGSVSVNANGNVVVITFQEPFFEYTEGNLFVQMNNQARTGTASYNSFLGTTTNATGKARIEYQTALNGTLDRFEMINFLPKMVLEYESNLPTYTITASAGAGGSISPSGATPFVEGFDPQYIITPNPNFIIDKVTVDGNDVTEDVMINLEGIVTYTFAPITDHHTITVTFKQAPVCTITATTDGNGNVSPNIVPPHYAGMTVTYNINPNEGFDIDSVFIDGYFTAIKGKSYTFTYLNRDRSIHVTFKKSYAKKITIGTCGTAEEKIPVFCTKISVNGDHQGQMIYQNTASYPDLANLPAEAQIRKITFHTQTHQNVNFEGNKVIVKLDNVAKTATSVQPFLPVSSEAKEYEQILGVDNSEMEWVFNSDTPFIYKGNNLLIDIKYVKWNGIEISGIFYPTVQWCAMSRTGGSRMASSATNIGSHNIDLIPQITIEYLAKYTLTSTAGAHGIISPRETGTYDAGYRKTFTIRPDAGYQIDAVLWNGTDVTDHLVNNGNGTYSYTTEPLEDNSTVSVSFKLIEYTITYHNLKDAENTNPDIYNKETPNIILAPLTKDHYIFNGWYNNANYTGTQVTQISRGSSGNKELWAKWTPLSYTITYHNVKSADSTINPATYTIETATVTLKNLHLDGYEFNGWYNSENEQVSEIPKGSFGPKEFWAKWTAITYQIAYRNVGEDENINPNPATYTRDDTPLALLPLNVADFNGWYDNIGLTGNPVTEIPAGSFGNKTFWAKLGSGIAGREIQNVQVYSYMNTVYIVNKDQIPLKSLEITDITGRIVYRSTSVQSPVSLNVAEGQYIVRIMSDNAVLNTKISIY